jgi:hypothetical protein
MKERPILFKSEMVEAILRELMPKTQTRREIREPYGIVPSANGQLLTVNGWLPELDNPFGQPGDLLWVKETHWRYGQWRHNGVTAKGRQKWKFVPLLHDLGVQFKSPAPTPMRGKTGWHKRPSLFMPRLASRVVLEIVKVRAERLNDIGESGAVAEGAPEPTGHIGFYPAPWATGKPGPINYRESFRKLWESINGVGSWDRNDYVWAIEFKKHYERHNKN